MEFHDLKKQYDALKFEIDKNINDAIISTNFILGKQVMELEKELASYVGVKHCVTCANGTDALNLVLMAWGVGHEDAVFVPDFTYIASASVVSVRSATPIFVDVDKDTFNMCPDSLEKAIEAVYIEGKLRPRAIISVDLFGQPVNYQKIEKIAKKYNLLLLEDGAQGFGGEICGKKACSFGDASTTSFFPAKPLGCYGDGGAIFTNDDEIDALLRSLRSNGRSPFDKYDNVRIGLNSRLDTIQAAILLPKLKAFREYELDALNVAAQAYNKYLSEVPEVTIPTINEGYISSWAQYTIKVDTRENRENLQIFLREKGIPSMVYYLRPLHRQSAFKNNQFTNYMYNISELLSEIVLSLPIHPYIRNEEIEMVCDTIKLFYKK